jgi:hypothetical protein
MLPDLTIIRRTVRAIHAIEPFLSVQTIAREEKGAPDTGIVILHLFPGVEAWWDNDGHEWRGRIVQHYDPESTPEERTTRDTAGVVTHWLMTGVPFGGDNIGAAADTIIAASRPFSGFAWEMASNPYPLIP